MAGVVACAILRKVRTQLKYGVHEYVALCASSSKLPLKKEGEGAKYGMTNDNAIKAILQEKIQM
jgi:hypothetical protein